MNIISKEEFIRALVSIRERGWIDNARRGNDGGVGNTLEDLLGIKENNLPIPNAAEWELKAQRANTSSLTTLLHCEPSPRAIRFVPSILLPNYGWKHEKAGIDYPESERSFRQTINGLRYSSRGFKVILDRKNDKVEISFSKDNVSTDNLDWLQEVKHNIGLEEINPQPYWGIDELFHKIGVKLGNCFYVIADSRTYKGRMQFHYNRILMLSAFSKGKLMEAFEKGLIYVDFDARTGHNHGTKFRMSKGALPSLYSVVKEL